MQYVRKESVVKEIFDNLASDYLAQGWIIADKSDYEQAQNVNVRPQTGRKVTAYGDNV